MEQIDLEVLSRFEAVWQRVQNGHTEQTRPLAEMEPVMEALYYGWKGCCRLASCTCGRERFRLQALANGNREQFRTLQLRYYLETGDIFLPDVSLNFASYTPSNLRKLWQSTVRNEETLEKCNLNGNLAWVAELQSVEAEIQHQKRELADLIKELLQ